MDFAVLYTAKSAINGFTRTVVFVGFVEMKRVFKFYTKDAIPKSVLASEMKMQCRNCGKQPEKKCTAVTKRERLSRRSC